MSQKKPRVAWDVMVRWACGTILMGAPGFPRPPDGTTLREWVQELHGEYAIQGTDFVIEV